MVDISDFPALRVAEPGVTSGFGSLRRRARYPAPAMHAAGFSGAQIALLFAVLAALASVPVVLHPWPPLSDYINHLARMQVIANVDGDPDLARFYQVDWQVIPNLLMDLVVPPLQRVMDVYLAGQVYTIACFLLIMSGTLALNRRLFGQWSAFPLIAFPLLYNRVYLVGTMNFVFGIGLALWALVAWTALRERAAWLRLAVSTGFVLVLFISHLFSVGIYALGLLAFELQRLPPLHRSAPSPSASSQAQNPWPSALIDLIASGLPFLPVIPLLLSSPTWGLGGSFDWDRHGKLDGILYAISVYSPALAYLLTAGVALVLGFALYHRAVHLHRFGWVLLIVGGLVYLAMPRIMFETYMADQRLPIALAFILVSSVQVSVRDELARNAFAAALVLLLALRVGEVQGAWDGLARGSDAFRQSVQQIDRGAKVLVAYADPEAGDNARDLWLVHAACLAIIERSALVTTAFTVVGKQILHVRAAYRARVDTEDGTPPAVRQLLQPGDRLRDPEPPYWARWTTDYDYLYVLFTDTRYKNPDPARLAPVYAGERFALYRVTRPPQPAKVASLEPSAPERSRFTFATRVRARPHFDRTTLPEKTGTLPDQPSGQSRSLKR